MQNEQNVTCQIFLMRVVYVLPYELSYFGNFINRFPGQKLQKILGILAGKKRIVYRGTHFDAFDLLNTSFPPFTPFTFE